MSDRFDVVGIGNAIVDILARCDDAFLATHGSSKGHMQLVDEEEISRLYDAVGPAIEISGGSAANTIAGIASLGGATAYIGKIADDEFVLCRNNPAEPHNGTYRITVHAGEIA